MTNYRWPANFNRRYATAISGKQAITSPAWYQAGLSRSVSLRDLETLKNIEMYAHINFPIQASSHPLMSFHWMPTEPLNKINDFIGLNVCASTKLSIISSRVSQVYIYIYVILRYLADCWSLHITSIKK